MALIKKIPVPISGLALGLAALGNLVVTYSAELRYVLGVLSLLVLLLLTLRIFADFAGAKKEMENPLVLGVFSTYPMTLVLLAAYLKPFAGTAATVLWVAALALHLVLILIFIARHVLKFTMKAVSTGWFIMFVGFVVGSVTAPAMGMLAVGQVLFYIGFACYIVLLPIMLYRVFGLKDIPPPAKPAYAIFCAPISLCLAGYLSSFEQKNAALVYIMLALSVVSYLGVLVAMAAKLLRLPFFPSYSAFTFPLVISAIAQKMSLVFLQAQGIALPPVIIDITTIIAAAAVAYVLVRYLVFLAAAPAPNKAKA